jgi:hypothetical protein
MATKRELLNQLHSLEHKGFATLLATGAQKHGLSVPYLYAIASRETNCINELGDFRGGEFHGVGIIQIDIQHKIARDALPLVLHAQWLLYVISRVLQGELDTPLVGLQGYDTRPPTYTARVDPEQGGPSESGRAISTERLILLSHVRNEEPTLRQAGLGAVRPV